MDTNIEAKSSRQIKIGAVISYLALALDVVAGLLYTPWIIRQIGDADYGLYTLATSLITMFMLDFGMSAAVAKFVSHYRAKGDQQGMNNFLGMIYKLYIIVSAVICAVLVGVFFNINQIYIKLTPSELSAFKIVYLIAASSMVVCFPFITLNGILTAHEQFARLKLADVFNKVASIFLTIIALLFGMGLYALVAVHAVMNLLTIVVKLVMIRKTTKIKVNFQHSDKGMLKEITGFSFWTTVQSIAQRFIFNITPTVLGVVSGSVGITMFGLASTLEGYVFKFSQAINGMFMPKISRATLGQKTGEAVLPLMIKVGRIVLSITGILVIGIVTLGQNFVNVWLGNGYQEVYICTVLLILPSVLHLPQQVANTAVVVLDKVKSAGIVYTIMALVNIVFSFLFGHFWGAVGCSLSICIAYFVRTILMNVVFYKQLNINVFKFFKDCHGKMAPGLLVALGCGVLISRYVMVGSGWICFLTQVVCLMICYVAIMWLIGWNKSEKNLFLSPVRTVLKRSKAK
ncbi:MAG: oligosaccharide flippase family protein [Clostridia bacterium]|nr:oligosaccharide flippase family protein [Clostridia bacterium]